MAFVPITDLKIKIENPRITQEKENVVEALCSDGIRTDEFELRHDNEDRDIEKLSEAIEQLGALRDSVKRHGLTRSLVSFADYNKKLSGAISALESLGTDLSVRKSKDVVVALEASIADHIELFLRKLKARAKNLIARITSKVERLESDILHIKTMQKMIEEGRELSETLAKTKSFFLLDRNTLFEYFKCSYREEEFARRLVSEKLPDGEAEYKTWLTHIRDEFKKISNEVTNLEINEYGRFQVIDSSRGGATRDTLSGHGYKLEDFIAIAEEFHKSEKLLREFSSHILKIVDLLRISQNDPTMLYLHKAAVTALNIVWVLAEQTAWNKSVAAMSVLRAIFTCTEKK